MARCLIVGCGCRGRSLAVALIGRGYAVRGTTRSEQRLADIAGVGAEAVIADPGHVASLVPWLDQVALVCILLGTAFGEELHGSRLEMLLQRMLDTTVRGVLYEGAAGAALVRASCERSRIPYALLQAAPSDHEVWLREALSAIGQLIGTG